MSSTYINYRTQDDIYNQIKNYMQKGFVQVDLEKVNFLQGTSEYTLSNGYLVSVSAIEGIRADGHYIPPTDSFNGVSALVEGTDYTLTRSVSQTDGAGTDVYDTITFTNNLLFEHNKTILISYMYWDTNKKTNITNFSDGSIAGMIAKSMAIQLASLYKQNERQYNAGFISLATSSDLDNHGEIWGKPRSTGTPASGVVKVSAGSGDFTVTPNTAFVAGIAGVNLIFNAVSGTGLISSGTTQELTVQSNENGYKYNVGANSIGKIYSDNTLVTLQSTATITVNNWTVKDDGGVNTFTGGTDRETDAVYRNRLYLQPQKIGRGSIPAIESAVEDLDIVGDATIYDWHTSKDVATSNFRVFVTSNVGNKLLTDSASVSAINTVLEAYRPAGNSYDIKHPMPIMVYLSGTAVIEDGEFDNRTAIISGVDTAITEYITGLGLGEDVIHAEMLERAMGIGGVYDFAINSLLYSEFASNPISTNLTDVVLEDSRTGTANYLSPPAYQEVKFMSQGREDTWIYSGVSAFTTEYAYINNAPTPSVYLAIDDGNGNYIRDPAFNIDWYTSNTSSTITIAPTAGSGVNRVLANGVDRLKFYYETATQSGINGVRVKLHGGYVSGVTTGTVKMELWSGTGDPSTAPTEILESGTITVLSGTDDYLVTFGSGTRNVFDATANYYVLLSGTSGSGTILSGAYISLPVSQSGTTGAQSTKLYSGVSDVALASQTWGQVINKTAMVHTTITSSGTGNIPIEGNALIPDIAVAYNIEIGYSLKSAVT